MILDLKGNRRSGSCQGFRNSWLSLAITETLGVFRYKVTAIGPARRDHGRFVCEVRLLNQQLTRH